MLADHGLLLTDLGSVTADTTASSINVFDSVEFVDIIPCFGHKGNLFLTLACTSGSPVLKATFGTCRQVMVRLDGKKSHLRKESLQTACEQARIKYRKPLYPGKTRFGSQEKTGQRCIDLKEAIFLLPDIDPSSRDDDHAAAAPSDGEEENEGANSRSSWADIKRDLNNAYPILDLIIPLFREIEQWTQIISSKRNPTLSKCRLACRRLKQHIDELEMQVGSMQAGKLKSDLEDAIAGLVEARETHMDHRYYMFPTIRVAEFLDVEVFPTIPPAEWKELRGETGSDGTHKPGLIANYLLEKDAISPAELARRIAAATPVLRGIARRAPTAPRLSEEDQALFDLKKGLALSDANPLFEEIKAYISLARALPAESRSTLGFWKDNSARLPILSKVARKVLAISGTSCDVERLFSRAGLICSALRNRLAPKTIQCLSSLHYFYAAEEQAQQSTRSKNADARAKRFAALTTDLLIEAGDRYISDSDSEDETDF